MIDVANDQNTDIESHIFSPLIEHESIYVHIFSTRQGSKYQTILITTEALSKYNTSRTTIIITTAITKLKMVFPHEYRGDDPTPLRNPTKATSDNMYKRLSATWHCFTFLAGTAGEERRAI